MRIERAGWIGSVVLSRPERGNAMSLLMFEEIEAAFGELDGDGSVRVIVLRGEGRAFTFGLDLMDAMQTLGPLVGGGGLAGPRGELRELIVKLQRQTGAPARCRKPVVAAVQGWCIGGGLDLIAGCDVRLCSADARFSLREARIGIVADLGSLQRLPGIIGEAATRELALTAKDIDAGRALRMGLVSDVEADAEALLSRAMEEAERIASLSPVVVQGVKHVLDVQREAAIEAGLRYVATWNSAFLASEDFAEAVSAFMEKRAPQYQGR